MTTRKKKKVREAWAVEIYGTIIHVNLTSKTKSEAISDYDKYRKEHRIIGFDVPFLKSGYRCRKIEMRVK